MISNPNLQVSVAMCTYNGARFIEEQLWSIFRQTVLPQEIVVSDDGSSDQTLLLIEKTYTEASTSINGVKEIALKVLRNPSPLGVTKNFEQAIANCSEPLIALSDQDDVWLPNRLEKLVGEFNRRPDLMLVHHDSELVDEKTNSLGMTTFQALRMSSKEKNLIHCGNAVDALLKRNLVTGATTVFKRSVYEIARPFPTSWVHDEWLAINAASIGRVDFIDECLIQYRQHSNNQIGVKRIGFRQVIGRMIYPRTERNLQLLKRSEDLNFKSEEIGFPELTQQKIQEKLAHEINRSHYPSARIKRISPVIHSISYKNYARYGLGFQDIIRDLLQSPK